MREVIRCDPVAMIGAAYSLGQFTSHERVGSIDGPVSVVNTLRDQLVSPSRQRKLAQAIPGATIHPADTDHAACVLGARAFVPAPVAHCGSAASRLAGARRL